MTPEQNNRLKKISSELEKLTDELEVRELSNLFASTKLDSAGTLVLAANEEGCLYFALMFLGLAENARQHEHYHFDHTTALAECEKPIVIKFESAPWEKNA